MQRRRVPALEKELEGAKKAKLEAENRVVPFEKRAVAAQELAQQAQEQAEKHKAELGKVREAVGAMLRERDDALQQAAQEQKRLVSALRLERRKATNRDPDNRVAWMPSKPEAVFARQLEQLPALRLQLAALLSKLETMRGLEREEHIAHRCGKFLDGLARVVQRLIEQEEDPLKPHRERDAESPPPPAGKLKPHPPEKAAPGRRKQPTSPTRDRRDEQEGLRKKGKVASLPSLHAPAPAPVSKVPSLPHLPQRGRLVDTEAVRLV